MATFIEYSLADNTTLLIEDASVKQGSLVNVSNLGDNIILKADKLFENALDCVRSSSSVLLKQLEAAKADEIEVKFALKTTGKMGIFAIGSLGTEATFEITLKWNGKSK